MRFLLSIHDVRPGNFALVEGHLSRLRALGARRIALLVVPDYHGHDPMGAAPEFLAWLREKAGSGSEILLHGFRHLAEERVAASDAASVALSAGSGPPAADASGSGRDGLGKRAWWGRWVNETLVDGEAEFCGLSAMAASELLARGASAIRDAGFPAWGFVAPTWHGSPPLPALAAHGIVLRETRCFLRHIPTGRLRFAPPLAWSRPGPAASLVGGEAWLAAALRLPLIKVSLHPGDLDSAGAVAAVELVLARGRECAYREVFAADSRDAAIIPP